MCLEMKKPTGQTRAVLLTDEAKWNFFEKYIIDLCRGCSVQGQWNKCTEFRDKARWAIIMLFCVAG